MMNTRPGILGTVLLFLTACSGGPSDQDASMSTEQTSVVATSVTQTQDESAITGSVENTDTMKIDFETRMIYLPATGWIVEDEFWNIYYNEPEKLPGTLDFDVLHQLGYREAPADGAKGEGV